MKKELERERAKLDIMIKETLDENLPVMETEKIRSRTGRLMRFLTSYKGKKIEKDRDSAYGAVLILEE